MWWAVGFVWPARRYIGAGQEQTNDYATTTAEAGFLMRCSCASPPCRHVVTGDDWRRPELQARYGGHWVPALLARIRSSAV
jgi:hypothetical protein